MMRVVLQPAQLGIDCGIVLPAPSVQPGDERGSCAAFAQRIGLSSEDGVSAAEAFEERAQSSGVQAGSADQSEPGGE